MNTRDVLLANLIDQPSASMPGMVEYGSHVPDDVVDANAIVDRILADERITVSMSSPPADDVREALVTAVLDACESADAVYVQEAQEIADAILAAFEVRPYGTVTDAAHDRDGVMICRKCGAGLNALDVVDGEKPCPGPRGTVVDTEVASRLRELLANYLDLRTVARVMADLDRIRQEHHNSSGSAR